MKLPPPTHHRGVHAGHYTVTITNGTVHVTRPAWADPPRSTSWPPTGTTGFAWTPSDDAPGHINAGDHATPGDRTGPGDRSTLRPVRAFPMVGDPPPLAANRPADFEPWGHEALDTG